MIVDKKENILIEDIMDFNKLCDVMAENFGQVGLTEEAAKALIVKQLLYVWGFRSSIDRTTIAKIEDTRQFGNLLDNEDKLREIFGITNLKPSNRDPLTRIVELSRNIFWEWTGSRLTEVKYSNKANNNIYGYILKPPTDDPDNYLFDYFASCLRGTDQRTDERR